MIPIVLCGCPEPKDPRPVASIKIDEATDPQVVGDAIRKELSDHKFDRRLIREGPGLKDYDQYQDVGPEMLWEVVGPYANLMEDMAKSGQADSARVMCQGILLGLRGYLDAPEKGESTGFYGDPAFAYACDVVVMYRNAQANCPPGLFEDAWWVDYEATDSLKNEINRFKSDILEARRPEKAEQQKAQNWSDEEEKKKIDAEHDRWILKAEWARRLRWAGLNNSEAEHKAANPGMLPDPE